MMGKTITNTVCHCLKMRRSAENVIHFYDNTLKPAGITVRQYSLLYQIRLHPGCSVRELAEATELDRSTLARSLKSLFASDYIEDRKAAGTRDSKLSLTTHGEATCSAAEALWHKAQKAYEEKLGMDTVRALENTLAELQSL